MTVPPNALSGAVARGIEQAQSRGLPPRRQGCAASQGVRQRQRRRRRRRRNICPCMLAPTALSTTILTRRATVPTTPAHCSGRFATTDRPTRQSRPPAFTSLYAHTRASSDLRSARISYVRPPEPTRLITTLTSRSCRSGSTITAALGQRTVRPLRSPTDGRERALSLARRRISSTSQRGRPTPGTGSGLESTYLVEVKNAVIVDVEATTAVRQAERLDVAPSWPVADGNPSA
jgi:hypothetical protein